jgi:S-methylmethionine-dependent homocysteine/selenocysteine methylase
MRSIFKAAKHSIMSFRDALAEDRVLLLDGGTGSELRRRGLALSDACWSASVNLEHGDLLEAIHRDYIAAGADIVTANTFGTSRFVLAAEGLDDSFAAVNRAALRAARNAADAAVAGTANAENSARPDRPVFVAASLSCMPPSFDRSAYPPTAEEYAAYCELAECFADSGVDLVLLEMLQSAPHAELACRAVRAAGLPFVAGLSCRLRAAPRRAGGKRVDPSLSAQDLVTFDDVSLPIEPALDAVIEFAPDAIAIMHTPVEAMLPALDLLRGRWQGPIGAYAEIPYPEDPEGNGAERLASDAYAAEARRWIAAGASIVGGCCGTMPAHITAIARI